MLTEQTRLSLADDVAYQSMGTGQETALLSLNSGYLFTCNETSAAFVSALDGKRTLGEVVDILFQRFDVSREKLCGDLKALAERLIHEELVTVAGEGGTADG
ncbi:MAG: PqqD family protein [Planctomycetia bacterium]|nr:PqqD family protein [Planctomycetia bacterium]